MSKNFVGVFNDALDKLEEEAGEVGETLTSICRVTKISRATPDRWRKKTPKSVLLLAEMQSIVTDKRDKLIKEAADALHQD